MTGPDRLDPVDRAVVAADRQLLAVLRAAHDADAGLAAIGPDAPNRDVDAAEAAADIGLLGVLRAAHDADVGLAAIRAAALAREPARAEPDSSGATNQDDLAADEEPPAYTARAGDMRTVSTSPGSRAGRHSWWADPRPRVADPASALPLVAAAGATPAGWDTQHGDYGNSVESPLAESLRLGYRPSRVQRQAAPPVRAPHPTVDAQGGQAQEATRSTQLVRPYAVTGGRTRPDYELAIEALVSTVGLGGPMLESTAPERQLICELCHRTRSVAEIAAYLRLPLGVVRVVLADMEQEGLVRVHQHAASAERPDLALLERVLAGLRRL